MPNTNCKICGHPYSSHDHRVSTIKNLGGPFCSDCGDVCKNK